MKNKKQGVSLIVLVITIIVMIILAGAVIISLSNTGIIGKANNAVSESNLKEVQQLATLAWSEAYLDNRDVADEETRLANIEKAVNNALRELNVQDKYNAEITLKGVIITKKHNGPTLGSLVASAEDYGKVVEYTANGVNSWMVLYETDDYVYLIASEPLQESQIPTTLPEGITIGSQTQILNGQTYTWGTVTLGAITTVAELDRPELWMANFGDYSSFETARCISYLLNEQCWQAFANKATYGTNVVGAIGTPTLEMVVASWNAKRALLESDTQYRVEFELEKETYGYKLYNAATTPTTLIGPNPTYMMGETDKLYFWGPLGNMALATPGECDYGDYGYMYLINCGSVMGNTTYGRAIDMAMKNYMAYQLRPVVCLKSGTPAETSTVEGIDISLIEQ